MKDNGVENKWRVRKRLRVRSTRGSMRGKEVRLRLISLVCVPLCTVVFTDERLGEDIFGAYQQLWLIRVRAR